MNLDQLNEFFATYAYVLYIIFAIFCSLALYFFWGKKRELSVNALDNTLATIAINVLNLLLAMLYFEEINAVLQSVYAFLHIPHLPPTIWDNVPFLVVCVVGLLSTDFMGYMCHRFMHTKWAWPAHAAHHSDTHVNAFTTFRVHIFESLILMGGGIFMLTWMQMPEALPVVTVCSILINMYVHIDLDIHHGRFKYVLASPRYHRWHHADVPEAYGKNLANLFPFYDKIFGTYYVPGPCDEEMGAIKTGVKDTDILDLIFYPFKEWGRMAKEALGQKDKQETPKMENL